MNSRHFLHKVCLTACSAVCGTLALAGTTGGYANLWTFDVTATDAAVGDLHLVKLAEWGSYRFPLPVRAPDGRTGGCLHFPHDPAANVHYRILTSGPTVACGTNAFTVGAWIRPVFTNVSSAVLFCGAYPSADSNRRLLQVNVSSHSVSHSDVSWEQQRIELPRGTLDDGDWHHVCVTETANERRLYVDGTLLDVASGPYDIDRGPLSIGGKDTWSNDFEGDMDDVFVIARALSADEVWKLVNETESESPPPRPEIQEGSGTAYVWSTKGGGLSSIGLGNLSLTPHLVGANWKSVAGSSASYGVERDGSRHFTIATDEGQPMDGRLVLTQKDERTVRATWTFTPACDTSYYQIEVQTFLSVPAWQDGRVILGSNAHSLPLKTKAIVSVSSVTFENAAGETVFTMAFPDAKRSVDVGVPSSWDVETMSFAVYRTSAWPLGTLTAGKDYVLTIDLSAKGPVKLVDDPVTCIASGAGWIPLDPMRFPLPGSALDFTAQRGTTGVAGAQGRVICVGDRFAFASDPTGCPRFYGNNVDVDNGCPTGEDAARFARNMAAFGYNALRLWMQDGIAWQDTGDPALVELNPAGIEKVDWLLAKCFENGIYVTLDLSCDRTNTWRSVGVPLDGNLPSSAVSYLAGIHGGIRTNYLNWVKSFFTHRNPYTGRTYAEEPALLGFNLLNESNNSLSRAPTAYPSALRDLAQEAWRAYAARKRTEDPTTYGSLTDALPSSFSELPNGPAYMQMIAEGERRLAADARRLFREELGCPIPLSNLNGGSFNIPLVAAKDAYDYDDDHRYVDHPSFLEESWRLPARAGNNNRNFIADASFGHIYATRLIDRPFTISEDNLCTPWRNAAVSGFALGAVSALQGTSATYRFSWAGSAICTTPERQSPDNNFYIAANPLMAASERLAVALFSRGDLPSFGKRYVYTLDPALARQPAASNNDHPGTYFPLGWAAWRTRVGLTVTNAAPAGTISAGAWPAVMRKTRPESCAELDIASPSGVETLDGGSTVEVDQRAGSLFVATPRTAAGYAEFGTITAGPLVADIGPAPATVWASALDGQPLNASSRLLFGHLTEAQAEGRRFSDPSKGVLLAWGSGKNLMRAGRADVALALGCGRFRVYALAADGSRRFEVPCRNEGDVLHFTADVAAEPTRATCLYEIERIHGLHVIVK